MQTKQLKTLQLISVRWWNASAYYAISLTEALNRAGVYSVAAGRGSSPPLQKANHFNVPTFTEIDLETFNPIRALRNLRQLKQFVTRSNIRLINGHRAEDGLYGFILKALSPTPLPIVRTASDVRAPKSHSLNRWLYQRGLDHIIFSCKASYRRYQGVWPIFENKSTVIYSAIDTDEFHPMQSPSNLRRSLHVSDEEVVIGIIARLSPVKDHHTFLKAAALVYQQAPHTRFLISGENAQLTHTDLKQVARELGIFDRVIFLPRDDNIPVKELIHVLDIGVVASNGSEVICRVSVEYMAMGKPQVVTDVNVLPEIVADGRNGFVVPAGDARAMASALLPLVKNPDLRHRIGETGRKYAVEKYSYPIFAEKTLAVYRRLIENAG